MALADNHNKWVSLYNIQYKTLWWIRTCYKCSNFSIWSAFSVYFRINFELIQFIFEFQLFPMGSPFRNKFIIVFSKILSWSFQICSKIHLDCCEREKDKKSGMLHYHVWIYSVIWCFKFEIFKWIFITCKHIVFMCLSWRVPLIGRKRKKWDFKSGTLWYIQHETHYGGYVHFLKPFDKHLHYETWTPTRIEITFNKNQ